MTTVGRIIDRVIDIALYLAFAMIIFSLFSVCAEVILRYFLLKPIKWVVEVNEYLLIWITFLATAWLLKMERHVVIDLFTGRLNARKRALFGVISSCIGAPICLILAWAGVVATWGVFQEGTIVYWSVIDAPKYAVVSVIPLGCFLLFLQFIRRAYGYFIIWNSETGRAAE